MVSRGKIIPGQSDPESNGNEKYPILHRAPEVEPHHLSVEKMLMN